MCPNYVLYSVTSNAVKAADFMGMPNLMDSAPSVFVNEMIKERKVSCSFMNSKNKCIFLRFMLIFVIKPSRKHFLLVQIWRIRVTLTQLADCPHKTFWRERQTRGRTVCRKYPQVRLLRRSLSCLLYFKKLFNRIR